MLQMYLLGVMNALSWKDVEQLEIKKGRQYFVNPFYKTVLN